MKFNNSITLHLAVAILLALEAPLPSLAGIRVHSGAVIEVPEATFFAFDQHSIPFRRNLHLTMVPPEKHPTSVMPRGVAGAFDELRAEYYGTVIKIDGKYRMWYVGYGFGDENQMTLAGVVSNVGYAESLDGINWTKPNLGLVSFRGSTFNNIVAIEPEDYTRTHPDRNVHVLYEPDDPDPSRRFKMVLYAPYGGDRWPGRGTMVTLLSQDGLHWRYAFPVKLVRNDRTGKMQFDSSSIPLPAEHMEGGSLIKLGNIYYLNGQQLNLPDGSLTGRVMSTFWSSDFIHWNPEKALSFVRSKYDFKTPLGQGQEVHEGAALWNRGNVLVGIYGRWQGAKAWRDLRLDLGLISSVDAIHFTEPDPSFVFARRGEPGQWDSGGLLQGQGFENVGDYTYIWYGSWNLSVSGDKLDGELDMLTSHGEVGLLKLRRDGFGYLAMLEPQEAKVHETFYSGHGSLLTAPFTVSGQPARVFLNAEFESAGSIKVELLDQSGRPIDGFAKENFVPMKQDGLREAIGWKKRRTIPEGGPYRLRVAFEHEKKDSPRLYAIYVEAERAAEVK